MRNVYPVFFTKTNDNVLVEVPDLDILTEGKDMNDAINMARDAIELKCVSMEDEKEEDMECCGIASGMLPAYEWMWQGTGDCNYKKPNLICV